jgi:4-alpha-glucanotransferase
MGFWRTLKRPARKAFLEVIQSDGSEAINWALMKAVLGSGAEMALYPIQDVLGQESKFRTNTPSVCGGNWQNRFEMADLLRNVDRLGQLTTECGRDNG